MTKKKLFLSLFVFILVVGLGFTSFAWIGRDSAAEEARLTTPPANENISVTVKKRETGEILEPTGSGTFDKVAYNSYAWHDLECFEVKATSLPEQMPEGGWKYSVEVQFLQAVPTEGGEFQGYDDSMIAKPFATGIATSAQEISATYYMDKDSESTHTSFDYGNGIYRFSIKLTYDENSQPIYYSNLFYVTPDPVPESISLQIAHNEISSNTTLEGDFEFYIKNMDEIGKYIDQSLIRWYVSGKSLDGKKYVYHKADLGKGVPLRDDYFAEDEYDDCLYAATEDRIAGSKTFVLDTYGIAGEWEVFCVIYNATPARDNSNLDQLQILASSRNPNDPYIVRTVGEMNTNYVIWIIVAAAIVLVIGLVVIIVVSVRKEKVW